MFDVHVARCVGDVRSFCSNTRPHYLYGQNTFRKRTQKNVLTGEVQRDYLISFLRLQQFSPVIGMNNIDTAKPCFSTRRIV